MYLGRLQERIKDSYPHVQNLPTVQIPDDITPHTVKYRFRRAEEDWPLIQAGPGIATLNFTQQYHWESFLAAAKDFYPNLLDAYRLNGQGNPQFTSILLRYINAVYVNPDSFNVNEFLSSKLHTHMSLPKGVIGSAQMVGPPKAFQLNVAYPLKDPNSVGTLRFAMGAQSGKPALIWELVIQATSDVPQETSQFETWLRKAHDILEGWFFSLIEGELEIEFEGTSHAKPA
jgi:uncharacterized protein (TIGR04255 family)